MAQRVNALELTILKMLREMQLLSGRTSDPYAPAYRPGNVVPMNTSRVGRASPMPVAGNEAESLAMQTERPENQVHDRLHNIPYSGYVGVHPPEVVRKLREITSVDPDTASDIAFNNGMDLVELTDIAYAAFSKRELNCYDLYERPRDDVRFFRQMSVHGVEDRVGKYGPHMWRKSKDSCFKAFAQDTEPYEAALRLISIETISARLNTSYAPAPLVPGEAIARQRAAVLRRSEVNAEMAKRSDSRLSIKRLKRFQEIGKVSRRLHVETHVTTRSQMAALGTGWRGVMDVMRKAFGMNQRKMRLRAKRLEYIREVRRFDPNSHPRLRTLLKRNTNRSSPFYGTSKMTTVRTVPKTIERWQGLDVDMGNMSPRDRMNLVGNLLIKKGIADPLGVSAYQTYLISLYGELSLKQD
jgi:hypothetical protein